HVRVEVPAVAAALLRLLLLLALLALRGVMRLRLRVEVAAGEEDLLAVGPEIAAGRLADARADPADHAALQLHDEHLVERVLPLLLGLEDDLLGVGREVPLAGADEV